MLLGTYYLPLEQLKDKKGEECIGGHNGKKKNEWGEKCLSLNSLNRKKDKYVDAHTLYKKIKTL